MDGIDAKRQDHASGALAHHRGAIINSDLHVAAPPTRALLPYLEPVWQETITIRGIERFALNLASFPPNAPLTIRPDWRPESGRPGSDVAMVQRQALDAFGSRLAICNVLHAAPLFHTEDMAAAFCRAINDWMVENWLDKDSRLRASIVVPVQNAEMAATEIERCAADRRFVQVLLPGATETPLGKRHFWPIYEAAERHGLTIGIHAGSANIHPPTPNGWSSFYVEDYVAFAGIAENQLLSLIAEGVFLKFPSLKAVFLETGFMWLPIFMWRADKLWRGVRIEVPWLKEPPSDIVRRHARFTLQPVDAPPNSAQLERVVDHMRSDELILFSTDYPHHQYDGMDALPPGMSPSLAHKVLVENPANTYPRLSGETAS